MKRVSFHEHFIRRIQIMVSAVIMLFLTGPAVATAQWRTSQFDLSGRYKSWWSDQLSPFAPTQAIGASSLAFHPDGDLYLCCEKFPYLLVFPKDGTVPRSVRLEDLLPDPDTGTFNVDLEAISICDDKIYVLDEDHPVIYETPVNAPGRVTPLTLVFSTPGVFSKSATTSNPSDLSSFEGLVVTRERLEWPPVRESVVEDGAPWFYLLDERDINATTGQRVAKLFCGRLRGQTIVISEPPITFDLQNDPDWMEGYRLPELFLHKRQLYALKTRWERERGGNYKIVRCRLDRGTLEEVADFSKIANAQKGNYEYNFEGAAVAQDGRLFLTADNEMLQTGVNSAPNTKGRALTPLFTLLPE